jgi:uncharacterized membrane protein
VSFLWYSKSFIIQTNSKNKKLYQGDKIMKKLANVLTVVKVAVMVLYLKEYRENALTEIERG